ncbi:MAG: T9SS type A sorting domain-containing protein [Saprospiraceae bacterium]|nr:T9SS type A sorting domain-containing protein [Saprospiraceae bacterium]
MKTILPLLFLILVLHYDTSAQCQPMNGDFESWTDYTDSFEHELALQLSHPIILPTEWFSLVRLLDIALSGFIIEYLDKDTLDIPIFEGLKQYMPGANGTASAARLSGDSLLLISDLIQYAGCGGRPDKLTGYFKYEGEGFDTLLIVAILHDGELIDTADAIGYAFFSVVGTPIDISRGSADYVAFSADFIYNSDEIPDSASIQIISTKDSQNPNDTSYHVVDEIRFDGGVVPTKDFYQEAPFALLPNPATDYLRVNLNDQGTVRVEMFDALGRRVINSLTNAQNDISITHLAAGTYLTRIQSQRQTYWQKVAVNR